jgi:hypothetical protein
MKTVVYQSFRTAGIPLWIDACMESVRFWAARQGFDYRFYDDSFFELVPPPLRKRASAFKCVQADYARLVAARQLLREGYDRAIWLDADAVVFAPDLFQIKIEQGYAFCREVWLDRMAWGKPHFNLTVNNSVSVFCRDETIIDFYLNVADAILSGPKTLTPLSIGTDFLLKLQRAHPFTLLTQVGIFGSKMASAVLRDDSKLLKPYLAYQTSPIYAANLCLSHQGDEPSGETDALLTDNDLLEFIRRLTKDQGASVNRWFTPTYRPSESEFDRPLSRYLATRRALKNLARTLSGT